MTQLPQIKDELARMIDHTVLKPEATREQIDQLCDECLKYRFASACVNPVWVEHCADRLRGSDTAVCTVTGFPLGASSSVAKGAEAIYTVQRGATEIDMVIHLSNLIAGNVSAVVRDIAAVVEATKSVNADAIVKVILETRALTDDQIIAGCQCAEAARADFVKTSTGFHPNGGATVENIRLMKANSGNMRVKAAGGIRDLPTALAMIEAGADRLGMSASVSVIEAMG